MDKFEANIIEGKSGGAFVEIPFDVKDKFGKARLKIQATFDGEPYRGSIVSMGGKYILGITKEIREKIGKSIGDKVLVTFEEDIEPRTVEVPQILQDAFARYPIAKVVFDKLSFSHKREHVNYISSAKKEETKARRVEKTIEALLQDVTRR